MGDFTASGSEATEKLKLKGVRKRRWGRWVSEVRLPKCRERIWLGSYDTPEKAARAFDAASFLLRGNGAALNFPDRIFEIANHCGSLENPTAKQIQVAAARYAHAAPLQQTHPASEDSAQLPEFEWEWMEPPFSGFNEFTYWDSEEQMEQQHLETESESSGYSLWEFEGNLRF